MLTLGIDTSNYTTSAALCDFDGARVAHLQRLLPVQPGEMGLRQSEALFHHTVQLPQVLEQLLPQAELPIAAVGVSDRPRNAEGSYMPCFLAGVAVAQGVAGALKVPLRRFSHQQGHLAAALFSAARMDLMEREFLAFHVSGGTTEMLHVRPGLQAKIIGGSDDLKAGQLVDRVGGFLGYPFPAGAALDALAQTGALIPGIKPSTKGLWCSLSGIENTTRRMYTRGVKKEDIALFTLVSVTVNLESLAQAAFREQGTLPLVFSGGVCCSTILRGLLLERFPDAVFAAPEFSSDNAAGIAVLAGALFIQGNEPCNTNH
ncbi:MAG: peptidase M22 [Oscillospiraceae bacterium]|jgi:N6-L-threonylcarbamoyladenine synthase|nr:peptidase M22 [Oscillospiraceae bacterium]